MNPANPELVLLLASAVFVIALLYSSVGHAGASGYIAVMALFGMAPGLIKPTALLLNIAVAGVAAWQFTKAGHFELRLFWPFAVLSIPGAFAGGWVNLPASTFKLVAGVVLLFSAARFLVRPPDESATRPPRRRTALATGGALGLLAGLTGTGGGIFLTPLMLCRHWAVTKTVAATSAWFILVNSVAGLAGNLSSTRNVPVLAAPLLLAAVAGGTAGSWLGCHRFAALHIKRLLALVLTIAGGKLILT